jgi:PAS domain S-box-containing protein
MTKIKAVIKSSPAVIALIYILIGFLWIQFSDQWVLNLVSNPEVMTRVQSWKGFFFVAGSGLLIYLLIRKNNNMLSEIIEQNQRTSKKFKSTIEHAPIGIAYNLPNEKWIDANKTLCNLLGYNHDELMNIGFSDFIHPDDLEKGRELDKKLAEGKVKFIDIKKRYIRKDGSQFPGLVRKSAVRKNNGETEYLITILEDITKQMEHESTMQQSLKEKEILLSEVHHRVKNNLALISALFELQNMYIDNKIVNEVLDKSNIRIKCLSLIHDNFSYSKNSAEIDFGNCLEQLINFLHSTLSINTRQVIFHQKISPVRLNINLAIPVALIFTELLINTNREKFQNINKPVCFIELNKNRHKVSLIITFKKPELLKNGDPENSDDLTFMIINRLVAQTDGNLQFSDKNGEATYTLTFAKKSKKGGASSMTERDFSAAL